MRLKCRGKKELPKVKIVTDSTGDLPEALAKELGIIVVPLKVFMDGEVFTAGVDLNSEEFYKKMPHLKDTPSTSPPSTLDFYQAYEDAAYEAEKIVSIHISSLMSETIKSAENAKKMLPIIDIRIYDAKTTGASLALIVLQAVWAANQGMEIEEICRLVEYAIEKVNVIGYPSTLKYLVKGGRIGRARGLVGNLLNRVPILTVQEGETSSITTVQGREKAIEWMIEYLKEEGLDRNSIIALTHGNIPDEAEVLSMKIESEFGCIPQFIELIGPVVGSHLGPGSIYFSYLIR